MTLEYWKTDAGTDSVAALVIPAALGRGRTFDLDATLLVSVLERLSPGQDLADLEADVQPHGSGGHYYTMHPELRARVLARLCT